MQKHIKKCFEGIKELEHAPARNNAKLVEAMGMRAPDGESVPFPNRVLMDGPVENWLILVCGRAPCCRPPCDGCVPSGPRRWRRP